jgi:hypothetical protein
MASTPPNALVVGLGNCDDAATPEMSVNEGCAAVHAPVAALYELSHSCATAAKVTGTMD